jgi:hypothetical protein
MSEGWWVLGGVVIGAIASGAVNLMLQKRQFSHEKEMHVIQNKSSENVKALLTEMLSHKSFTDRSFDAIRKKIGGYSDNEIRQLLHEIDAKKASRIDGKEEWWYLTSREEERIKNRAQSVDPSVSAPQK